MTSAASRPPHEVVDEDPPGAAWCRRRVPQQSRQAYNYLGRTSSCSWGVVSRRRFCSCVASVNQRVYGTTLGSVLKVRWC